MLGVAYSFDEEFDSELRRLTDDAPALVITRAGEAGKRAVAQAYAQVGRGYSWAGKRGKMLGDEEDPEPA